MTDLSISRERLQKEEQASCQHDVSREFMGLRGPGRRPQLTNCVSRMPTPVHA